MRRASAGLTPVRAGRRCSRSWSPRPGSTALASSNAFALATPRSRARRGRRRPPSSRPWRCPTARTCSPWRPGVLEARARDAADPARRGRHRRAPRRAPGRRRRAPPLLVWRTTNGSYLVDADGMLFAELGPDRRRPRRRCPSSTTRGSTPRCWASARRWTRRPRRRPAARVAVAGRRRQRGQRARVCARRRDGFTCATRPAGGPRCSASTRRRCARRPGPGPGPAAPEPARRHGRPPSSASSSPTSTAARCTPEPTRTPRPSKSPKP